MVKRSKSNIDIQPALFEIPGQWTHDYGDAAEDGGDFGHEFPFVWGNDIKLVEVQKGVSVSLVERRMAIQAVADMYGKYNQGKGMQKAVQIPQHRQDIEPRYADVDYVAERAEENGRYTPEEERAKLQPLLKERELLAAGFDPGEVDRIAISLIYQARQNFGIGVNSAERQKNLKKVK